MSLVPGSKLGHYEIVAPLGAGGMGEVFRARDTRLGRDVAIKALPDAFAQDPERLARFEREAKLLASLSHPSVAGIHGLELVEGHRYLVLEFVEGETLAARLARGPLPLGEAIEVCRQVASGVEAAHDAGVVHRDLKPGNVMLKPDGAVKVLDFGLAKGGAAHAASSGDPGLSASPTMTYAATSAGVILGTAAYMSPEQARGKAVDRRTDVWSFGALLYECLTGRQPYAGETVSDMVAKILEREPDWSALPAGTPARLRRLIERCMTKDPRERLQAIGEARIELAAIARGGAEPEPAPAAGAAARRGVPAWSIAAAAALAVLATVAALRFGTHESAPRTLRVSVLAPEGVEVSAEVPDLVISPDGGTVAFMGQDSMGVSHLWLRPLSASSAHVLPGTEGAKIPFWSPDSRELGFFANGSLKRIAIDGESAQTLTTAPNPRGAAWSRRGVIVFAPTASGPLLQVAASGGDARPATTLDTSRGESAHRFPSFLPDGRHFLYVALPGKNQLLDTRVGSLDGGSTPAVASSRSGATYAAPGYLVYNREGTIVGQPFDVRGLRTTGPARPIRDLKDVSGSYSGSPVVTASGDGVLLQREALDINVRVAVLDRAGHELSTLPLPPAYYSFPRLSPDGRHLVVCQSVVTETSAPLWMVDMTRGTSARFTTTGHFDTSPAWTPDGRYVIYGSDRTGGRELWWKRADGATGEERLAHVPNLFNDPGDLALDGGTVVYRSLSGATGEDVWALPLTGERKPRALVVTPFNEMDPALSPDGRWLAYRSDASGRFEVHVKSFPALDRTLQVSTTGASPTANNTLTRVRWRADGRELYFIANDGLTLMATPVTPGAEIQFGIPHPLFRLPQGTAGIEVSDDGQRVVACLPSGTRGRTVLNLLMNWVPELKATN